MKKHERQELAYKFLQGLNPGTTFTLAAFVKQTHWRESTARAHIQKHYSDWVERLGSGTYRIKHEFKRVTWDKFRSHSSQVRRVYTDYERACYSAVCFYELLLPMSRETELRATLDDLFFEDALGHRFDELGEQAEALIPKNKNDTSETYRKRFIAQAASWFGGYSISLVNGRFRAGELCSRADAAARPQQTSRPYLIDETTALVRFIVPIQSSRTVLGDAQDLFCSKAALEEDARRIRATFFALFVEAVVRIVNGEDVIWLLEESPLGRVLHTWELDRDE